MPKCPTDHCRNSSSWGTVLNATSQRHSPSLRSASDQTRHRRSAIARSDVLTGAGSARLLREAKSAPNLYAILGISSVADTPEIKAAFRRLAKSSHPDFNTDDATGNHRFHQVHLAYRVLCDTQMRAHY